MKPRFAINDYILFLSVICDILLIEAEGYFIKSVKLICIEKNSWSENVVYFSLFILEKRKEWLPNAGITVVTSLSVWLQ